MSICTMNGSTAEFGDPQDIVEDMRCGFTRDCEVRVDKRFIYSGYWHPSGELWYNMGGVAWFKIAAPEYSNIFEILHP